ncbi:hypothetical protein V8E54_013846 [Elaphomyces granulatus]
MTQCRYLRKVRQPGLQLSSCVVRCSGKICQIQVPWDTFCLLSPTIISEDHTLTSPLVPRRKRKKATTKHALPSSPLPTRQQRNSSPTATAKRSAPPSSQVSLSSRVTTPPPSTHTAFPPPTLAVFHARRLFPTKGLVVLPKPEDQRS